MIFDVLTRTPKWGRRFHSRFDPSNAAREDFNAALLAYKRRELMETLASTPAGEANCAGNTTDDVQQPNQNVGVVDSAVPESSAEAGGGTVAFRAAGALMFPGLDRGRAVWNEDNYQSSLVLKTVPVALGGFFTNGVAGEAEGAGRIHVSRGQWRMIVFERTAFMLSSRLHHRSSQIDTERRLASAADCFAHHLPKFTACACIAPFEQLLFTAHDHGLQMKHAPLSYNCIAGQAIVAGCLLFPPIPFVSCPSRLLSPLSPPLPALGSPA